MPFNNELFYIVPIDNIASIVKKGILCHKLAADIPHDSIAMSVIQERREGKKVTNALYLHDYVNLYFNPRNPMMYKTMNSSGDMYKQICVLSVCPEVLSIPGVVVSDMNASKDLCKFMEPQEALENLDFDKIYVRNWNIPEMYDMLKGTTCAEVLVPGQVPYSFVNKAYVADINAEVSLRDMGFDKSISCNADMFFK